MTAGGTASRPVPRVATIPSGHPFLAVFVEQFLSGALFGRSTPLQPDEVAAARIFVPTRRAGDALAAVLAASAGRVGGVLLPRIIPLGDEDMLEDAALLTAGEGGDGDLPAAVPPLDRRLYLFEMVDGWRRAIASQRAEDGQREPFYVASSRSDAFALAGDLARLIDETIIEDVPLSRLTGALPERYDPALHDVYWTLTQRFLEIAAGQWPEVLVELNMLDIAERLKRQVRSLATHLSATVQRGPVVVAGSTGSVAATGDLMAAVARLPMGAVVLPGLDLLLDTEAWDRIGDEQSELPTRFAHPQVLLKRTLARIGVTRTEVMRLSDPALDDTRASLASEIFRPAECTAAWQARPPSGAVLDDAAARLRLIETADEREEALAIALVLRETLETPDATAALVTPDRALARRVITELERWGVNVSESAGQPLDGTPLASLARLALAAAAPAAGAVDLLALLRHPLARLGSGQETGDAVDTIEIAAMRGRRLTGGAAGLVAALRREADRTPGARDPAPRRRCTADDLAGALGLAERLAAALAGLAAPFAEGTAPLRTAAIAHKAVCEALLADGPVIAGWPDGEDGRALGQVFSAIIEARSDGPEVTLDDYAGMFDQLVGEANVRLWRPGHPRLKIWGLLEARLLDADRLVLGGLNEGVWPPDVRSDPFLNRPMRIALSLQPPERRVGQTAHDFMMLLGGREVFLTRAARKEGTPAIASRFVRRLSAYLGSATMERLRGKGQPYLDWARALDAPRSVTPAERPSPRPPANLFFERMNLTEVETLYRDPYTLFARRVLKLDPLDPIDPPIDARDRGNAVHQALADYTRSFAGHLPEDGVAALTAFGKDAFAAVAREDAETVAFWWRRFELFVPWFVAWDRKRRAGTHRLHVECGGRLPLDLVGGHRLMLHARADRIEIGETLLGAPELRIIDYKTGTPPSAKEVMAGHQPQLPLTAALVARGAFPDIDPESAGDVALAYVHVAQSRGAGKEQRIASKDEPLTQVIERQFEALRLHLDQYLLGQRGFTSHRLPKSTSYRSEYDHLARHLEWSLAGDSDDGEHE